VLDEVLKNDVHLETSSSYDIDIINHLLDAGKLSGREKIICNGFKQDRYIQKIAELINRNVLEVIPVIDNFGELDRLLELCNRKIEVGIRIASEEDPKFEFYTSRLGIRYKDIVPFYEGRIANNDMVSLKMLHFFIHANNYKA
jgi:arginine decarboxylase